MKNEKKIIWQKIVILSVVCLAIIIGIALLYTTTVDELASPTSNISPATQNVEPGETNVCIQVLVNSGVPVRTIGFKLNYPAGFTLTSFTSHILLPNMLEIGIPTVPSTSGMINYCQAGEATVVNGNIADICFTVPTVEDTYTLDLYDVALLNASGNPLTGVVVTDGTVTVTAGGEPLTAQCPSSKMGTVGTPVSFTGDATGGTESYTYQWDFDYTGSFTVDATGKTVSHTYATADTYTVALRVNDGSTTNTCYTTATITSPGGNPTVIVDPATQNVEPGETNVCIQILIDSNGEPIRTVGFKVTYPTSFTLTGFTSHLLLPDALEVGIPSIPSNSGMINYAQSGEATVINKSMATICFTAPVTPGSYTLNLHDVVLVDGLGNLVTGIRVKEGSVTITST